MAAKGVKSAAPAHRYIEGIGRRKTAVARVRIVSGKGHVMVNGKALDSYFTVARFREAARAPFEALKGEAYFDATVQVRGGGMSAQAEAVRHGLARALAHHDASFKKKLRVSGFLTRDPRMVERKKYGLKKARRAPQWQKR
jgi:small subunit ribosomal protein S9